MHTERIVKIIIGLLIIIGVAFVAVRIFPDTSGKNSLCYSQKDLDDAYARGWNELRDRIVASGRLGKAAVDSRLLGINGNITKIENNVITVKNSSADPLADPDFDSRYVVIDKETKIFEQTPKDESTYQKELNEYLLKSQSQGFDASTVVVPPNRYSNKEVSISALETGQLVSVSTGSDIKNEKKFTADEIVINLLRK